MKNDKKRITIYFRNGGLIISEVTKGEGISAIAKRMSSGGYMVCEDTLGGRLRQVAVNLGDASVVTLVNQD